MSYTFLQVLATRSPLSRHLSPLRPTSGNNPAMQLFLTTILATAAATALAARHPSGKAHARIQNGTVTGVHSDTYNQDFFLGVPYAQPPTGDLRFRNPRSLNVSFSANYEAAQYAPSCVGYGGDSVGYPLSEDCLYLNIVCPSGYEGEKLPVGFWMHGGGIRMGGARDLRYNMSFIVENSVEIGKPFIGVSINYRLAGWGYLSSQEVSASGNTNMGLRDQRMALQWVQENIAAFGGDPKKVTLWGESAGATSVGWQLTAFNGRDDKLFRAAIMQSGGPVPYRSYRIEADYQPKYNTLLNLTGCANALDNLDCLRRAPFEVINTYFNATGQTNVGQWWPIVDGDFIQKWNSIQLAEGAFVKVPIIDGANTDEGTSFSPTGVDTDGDFYGDVANDTAHAYLSPHFTSLALEAYPNTPEYFIPPIEELGNMSYPTSYGAQYRRSSAYWGDVTFIAERRGTCQAWANYGVDAFCYRFNTIANDSSSLLGATHFAEVAFVFDNTQGLGYRSGNPFGDKPQSYFDLAKLMSSTWSSFINDLNPSSWKGRNKGTPKWPVYDNANPTNIVWDANVSSLMHKEPDTWRQEGIQFIIDNAKAYRR
jgi:carboxylesterase type B